MVTKNTAGPKLWEQTCVEVTPEREFLSERKGKAIFYVDGPKTETAREPTVERLSTCS